MIKRKDKKGGFEVTTSQLIGFGIAIFILVIFVVFYFFGYDWFLDTIAKARNIMRFSGGGGFGGAGAGGDL